VLLGSPSHIKALLLTNSIPDVLPAHRILLKHLRSDLQPAADLQFAAPLHSPYLVEAFAQQAGQHQQVVVMDPHKVRV
jgi:hypothetical protein